MFWLEEQWGDPPGDREGSSCFSPLQERTREERKGKQIHSFPSDKPGVPGEGRVEGELSLSPRQREQQQRGRACAEPISTGHILKPQLNTEVPPSAKS